MVDPDGFRPHATPDPGCRGGGTADFFTRRNARGLREAEQSFCDRRAFRSGQATDLRWQRRCAQRETRLGLRRGILTPDRFGPGLRMVARWAEDSLPASG